jgi:hypothetical protein
MQILKDVLGFFSNVRRIREALERLSWPHDRRRQPSDIYKPRTFQSEK